MLAYFRVPVPQLLDSAVQGRSDERVRRGADQPGSSRQNQDQAHQGFPSVYFHNLPTVRCPVQYGKWENCISFAPRIRIYFRLDMVPTY